MKIHKEGRKLLVLTGASLVGINFLILQYWPSILIFAGLASLLLFVLILQFFRNPNREIHLTDDRLIYAPADGRVVVMEEVEEPEYFKDKRLQISIFMSPTNVHVNRNPVSGRVNYFKYHPGKYLVAWHPKSSELNERATIVIDSGDAEIMLRQIAGAMARRIKNYLDVGEEVIQGSEMGFIKFGSRVDLFLPLDAEIMVSIGQKVKGNKDVIAKI